MNMMKFARLILKNNFISLKYLSRSVHTMYHFSIKVQDVNTQQIICLRIIYLAEINSKKNK